MSSNPTIVIAGRPNVGKSTLFNRLTGTRAALVSDLPGLTRDRREGETDVFGTPVTLVDTAGLEAAAAGSIADRMRQQTARAVKTADLILFIIDARVGVTPPDEDFARIVRASGRPVILIANKSESRAAEAGFYDAFKLGLGAPVAVSAEHGEGIGDLEADMAAALGIKPPPAVRRSKRKRHEEPEPEAEETAAADPGEDSADDNAEDLARPIRVAIVGRPNAGKSTLVNALVGEDRMITGPEPGLTRDAVATDFTWGGRAFKLHDTAGLRRRARITETAEKLSASDAIRAIRFAEVVVLLIDAERPLEHQDLTIGDLVTQEGRALVVAINKWDLVEAKQKMLTTLKDKLAETLAQVPGVPFIAISALGENGLDKLMHAIIKAHETWNRRIPTPDLNRWLAEALARHAPPAISGRRLKIRYITQPASRPPTFAAFCSRAEDMPKSYLKYLSNSLREAFDLPGTPIRLNLRKSANPFDTKRKRR